MIESARTDPEMDRTTDPLNEPVLDPDCTEGGLPEILKDLLVLTDGGPLPGGWSGGDDCGVFSAMMIQNERKSNDETKTENYLQMIEVVINSVCCWRHQNGITKMRTYLQGMINRIQVDSVLATLD